MEKKSLSIIVVIFTLICVAIMLYNNSILEGYINSNRDTYISDKYKEEGPDMEVKTKEIGNTIYKMPKTIIMKKEEMEYENLKLDMKNYYESQNPESVNETYIGTNDKEMLTNASRKLSQKDYNKIQQYLLLDSKDSIVNAINLLRDRLTDEQYHNIKYIAEKYKN
ncbi:MAG: hypothetical protein K0R54_4421 [Clostridiaceae bacterium]|jgi:hypothetical protein|nr:hypothetical protein [Clostridiaceae bacterium]